MCHHAIAREAMPPQRSAKMLAMSFALDIEAVI
jgi:hypothetical protein